MCTRGKKDNFRLCPIIRVSIRIVNKPNQKIAELSMFPRCYHSYFGYYECARERVRISAGFSNIDSIKNNMNIDDDTIIIITNGCCVFRRTTVYRLHYTRYYTRARIVFKKARAYRQRTIYYHTRTAVAEEATRLRVECI